MNARILDSSLINALRKEGTYTFVVKVSEKWKPSTLAFVADIEETQRPATLELGEDWILEEDVQKQIDDFMKDNHVVRILHNGREVWSRESSHRKYIYIDGSYTNSCF